MDSAVMDDTADAPEAPMLPPVTRLPNFIRLPLVCLLSLALSIMMYTLVADWVGYEFAAVSRDLTDSWQVGALIVWRIASLVGAWYAGYDYQDFTALAFLANLPHYYLLHTFYSIDFWPCFTALAIDVMSVAIPFLLLRPLIHAHEAALTWSSNKEVAQDRGVYALVTVLGASITSLVVYGSFYTWLPVYLVVHFDGLRSVERAHNIALPLLLATFIPIGVASTHFLFTPAVGSPSNPGLIDPKLTPEKTAFDPETATLVQTIAWNLGYGPEGWTTRTEILAKRTAALTGSVFFNGFVRVLITIDGTEAVGAAGWASVWAAATALTGFAFAWVADE